jgi:hypothetical protein
VKRFCWLASYPKSGNTWLRAALQSLGRGGGQADLGALRAFAPVAAARDAFDEELDVESSDFAQDQIERLRPRFHEMQAARGDGLLVRKVHDAWTLTSDGVPLFPPHATRSAVYLVRDPRDVAVSYAAHVDVSIDRAIATMNDPGAAVFPGNSPQPQLRQRLLTWSMHVASWIDDAIPKPLVVRYEDMLIDMASQLARIAAHLELDVTPGIVARAAAATRLDALQAAEAHDGFSERPAHMPRFFRRGEAGAWRDVLSEEQARRVVRDHGVVMSRVGYA